MYTATAALMNITDGALMHVLTLYITANIGWAAYIILDMFLCFSTILKKP